MRVWMDVSTCAVKRDEMVEFFTGVQGLSFLERVSNTYYVTFFIPRGVILRHQ